MSDRLPDGVADVRAPGIWAEGRRRSWAEVKERSARLARVLADSGMDAGSVVGVLIGNQPEFIESVLAARRLGATTVPMSTQLTAREIAHICADAGITLVLADATGSPRVADVPVLTVAGPDHEVRMQRTDPWAARAASPPEPMLYTSGTTGVPKGVRRHGVTAAQQDAATAWTQRLFGVEPGERAIVATPLYHSAGYGYAMYVLSRGGEVVLMPRFDPEEMLRLIERHRITNLQLVPTMMHRLVRLPEQTRARYDVSSLRHVLHGAGPCSVEVKHQLIDWWGPVIHEYYGSTETGALVACDTAEWLERPGTVGRARDGAVVAILDDAGVRQPADVPGTVYGRHPAMAEFTYHRDEDKRRAAQCGDLVTAGDLGRLDDDGYLYIVSRRSDLIVCGGVNVYPAEVERQLLQMPGIRDCAVIGFDDEERGQVPIAFVESDPAAALTGEQVLEFLSGRLARVKTPRRVEVVDALPRDDAGKVRRTLLVEDSVPSRPRRSYPTAVLATAIDADTPLDEVRRVTLAWIERSVPARWRTATATADLDKLYRLRPPEVYRDWYRELAASGLVAADWPVPVGGLGVGRAAARVIDACLAEYRLNKMGAIGLFVAAPTIRRWGTAELQQRLLPPIVWDEERWCQLFSEPGAGSDLASLATSARRTGNGWRINGQKVWTSFAHEADFGILLTRTSPDQPKRKGITMFACPMSSPGIDVRPLRQLTGEAEFNEVFLDDVVIDDFFRLGPVDEGIAAAATTLAGERAMMSGAGAGGVRRPGGRSLEKLVRAAREPGPAGEAAPWTCPVTRQRLMHLWCRQQTLALTNVRAGVARRHGSSGPDSSIGKLLQSELNQDIQETWFDLLGSAAPGFDPADAEAADRLRGLLRSRANTIEGGTSEIQRNIIGERLLGLPREPDPYLAAPWSQIPRG